MSVQAERGIRAILDNLYTYFALLDTEGVVLEINKAPLEQGGYRREDVVGRRFQDTPWWTHDDAVRAQLVAALESARSGRTVRHDVVVRMGERLTPIEFQLSPVLDAQGAVEGLLAAGVDVSARHQADKDLRDSSELLSLFIRNSPIYAFIKEVSPGQSRVLRASENYVDMLGLTGSEMVGKSMADLFPAEFAAKITADDWSVASGGCVLTLDEELNDRHYTTVKFPIVLSDRTLLAGYTIDVTDRRRAEDALRASLARVERLHAQMITLSQMTHMLLGCEDRGEAYEVVSRGGASLFKGSHGALTVYDAGGTRLRVVARWGQPPVPDVFLASDCWAARLGAPHEVSEATQQVPCRHFTTPHDGPSLCLPLSVRGEPLGLLHVGSGRGLGGEAFEDLRLLALKASGVIEMALSNLALQETLRAQAIRDPLTGLFNRRFLDESLPRELMRRRRTGEPLVVAMLDLDHFKDFNDSFGHEAGDLVLQAVGSLLLRSVRTSDLACRYGGEELTLVMPRAGLDDARLRLETLRRAVSEVRVERQGQALPAITVSIGAVAALPGEQDGPALLGRADAALYRAKREGRDRVVVAEPAEPALERPPGR